jgi:hypothetical protein
MIRSAAHTGTLRVVHCHQTTPEAAGQLLVRAQASAAEHNMPQKTAVVWQPVPSASLTAASVTATNDTQAAFMTPSSQGGPTVSGV